MGPAYASFACALVLEERVRSSRHNAGLLRLLMSSVSGRGFFFGAVAFGVGVENADNSFSIDNTASSSTVFLMTYRGSVYYCRYGTTVSSINLLLEY